MCFCNSPDFTLSVLLKTSANGTDSSSSHWTNSRSICCGGWRESISTKTPERLDRPVRNSAIIRANRSLDARPVFA